MVTSWFTSSLLTNKIISPFSSLSKVQLKLSLSVETSKALSIYESSKLNSCCANACVAIKRRSKERVFLIVIIIYNVLVC